MRYFILGMILAISLPGCVSPLHAPVIPPPGWIYTSYRAPLDTRYSGSAFGTQKGVATVHYLSLPFTYRLLSVSWGDGSMAAAAKDGRIQTVQAADYEFTQVLGIYSQMTSIVYGQ